MPKLRQRETEGEIQAQRRRKKGTENRETESKRDLYCGTPKRVETKLQGSKDWPTEGGQPRWAGVGGDAARQGSDGASRGRLGHETGSWGDALWGTTGGCIQEKGLPACLCLLSCFRSLSLFCVSHTPLCPSLCLALPTPSSLRPRSKPPTDKRTSAPPSGGTPPQGKRNAIASGFRPAPLSTAKERRSSRKTRLHVRLSP